MDKKLELKINRYLFCSLFCRYSALKVYGQFDGDFNDFLRFVLILGFKEVGGFYG